MKHLKAASILQQNLRYLRELKGYSVQGMADALGGIHRATYYSWERGDAQPNIEMILLLAHEFDVSVDDLLSKGLNSKASKKFFVNTSGLYEVELVPFKAVAGYSAFYADPEWQEANLKRITIPFKPPLGEVRAFPVEGDSMEPKVSDGSYIVGVRLQDPKREVRDGRDYLIVTRDRGIMYKIFFRMGDGAELRSLNYKKHQPIRVPGEEIIQVWKYFCALDIGKIA